jgi:hypothetical protein
LPEEAAFAGIAHRRKGLLGAEKWLLKRETAGVKHRKSFFVYKMDRINACNRDGFCGIIMYKAANRRTQREKFLRSGKEGFCVTNNEAGTGSIAEKAAAGKAPQ